jgi:hypothetical protein
MDTAGDISLAYVDATPAKKTVAASTQVKGIWFPSQGKEVPFAVTPSKVSTQPSVAMNSTGTFVVAFTNSAKSSNDDVYVQRFTAGGTAKGAAIAVASSSNVEHEPSAAIDTNGDFVVAYTYVRGIQTVVEPPFASYSNYLTEVHAVLYDALGVERAADTVWASTAVTQNAYNPSASMNGVGDFVVGYTKGGNDGTWDPGDGAPGVWASAYGRTGALVQSGIDLSANMPGQANTDVPTASYYNTKPSVAVSLAGHLVADWQNYGTVFQGELMSTAVYTQTFVKAPFRYTLQDGTTINIFGGMPDTYHIAVTRDPGFTGPISISFSSLPPGVTAQVSGDNPSAQSEVITVKFESFDWVPGGSFSSVLHIGGGNVSLTRPVQFEVTPSTITKWLSSDGSTLVRGFTAAIIGTGFVPGSTVEFGSPAATATPSIIDPSGQTLWVKVPMNAVAGGRITIIRPGGDPIISTAFAQYTEGGILSLSTNHGYAPGYDSAFLQTGSEVDIAGYGFQPGARVIFGNPGTSNPKHLLALAGTAGIGAIPTAISPNGTWLSVDVPRYAVNGPVEVIEPDGTVLTNPSMQTFVVANYRNTDGFSFQNFNFNVTWDMVTGEYGSQVDSPEGLLFWAICAGAFNGKGACFGMSLTSVLLSEYESSQIDATNGLPSGAAPTVFNLEQNGPLTAMIEENHLAQLSAEIISYCKDWETQNLLFGINAAQVYSQIASALQKGDHPIISLQSGADHAVVAYDLEPGPKGDGDYYIDVYDPNRPFGPNNEQTDINTHMGIEQASRIYVDPASGWSFTMAGNSAPNSGGFDSLLVIPAGLVASGVTFPGSISGLFMILGSTGASTAASHGGATTPAGSSGVAPTAVEAMPAVSTAARELGSPSPLAEDGIAPLTFELPEVITGMPVPQGPEHGSWSFGSFKKLAHQGIHRISAIGQ